MEKRIISFENGVVTVEEVKTLTLSEDDIEAKVLELDMREFEANDAITKANEELNAITTERKELEEAKTILAEAKAKFATETVEPETKQEEIPFTEIVRGGF